MFARAALTVASALVAFATAQNSSSSAAGSAATSTGSAFATAPTTSPGTTGFNINNVTDTDKFNWCHAQINTCPLICGGSVSANQCDQTTLTYTCTCANGTTPDVAPYQQTIPFYVCQTTYIQCVNDHPNDAEGQQNCKNAETCGTLNATANEPSSATTSSAAASSASATSSAASTASTAGSGSGSATSAAASASSTAKSIAARMGPEVGMGIFAGLFFAVFKLLL